MRPSVKDGATHLRYN